MKLFKLTIFIFTLLCVACEEIPDDDNNNNNNDTTDLVKTDSISYPENVLFGNNFLALDDSSILVEADDYEIGAVLGKDAHLKLVMTNLSVIPPYEPGPVWFFYMDEIGWIIGDYNESSNYQVLTSHATGKISCSITFEGFGYPGACKIDFYENSDTITQTKYYFW
ncbi:MAG: hypothetical protein RBS13_04430 [Bacteroidales bacterium]|jgi:hypothetical protein|nr:hypothetical protein [Bacteroidales bacterium]